jgi:hypothetical protein
MTPIINEPLPCMFIFGHESATDIYQDGVRPLIMTLDKFMTPDPMGFAAGPSDLTEFVGNAPTDGTDPNGTQEIWPPLPAQPMMSVLPAQPMAPMLARPNFAPVFDPALQVPPIAGPGTNVGTQPWQDPGVTVDGLAGWGGNEKGTQLLCHFPTNRSCRQNSETDLSIKVMTCALFCFMVHKGRDAPLSIGQSK